MEVTMTKSNKGGEKIFIDKFGYHFRSVNANCDYRWVCDQRKSMHCRSMVITRKSSVEHKIVRPPTEHNHPGLSNGKIVCEYMTTVPKQVSTIENHVRELLPSKKAQLLKCRPAPAKKIKVPSPNRCDLIQGYMLKAEESSTNCWELAEAEVLDRSTTITSEGRISSDSIEMKPQSTHTNDVKSKSNLRPFVCSDQESDGTVNIRIFLEQRLLKSFVINAQHTSNVNIRIGKDDYTV